MYEQTYVLGVKAVVATIAAAVIIWDCTRRQRREWIRDSALAALGIVSFAAWFNFGEFHRNGQLYHYHEFLHYYLGAKYHSELGYTKLYDCVAAVETTRNFPTDASTRWTRDLETNQLTAGSPGARDPESCTRLFTPARWRAFSLDVSWFRARMSDKAWADAQADHGYNATPVWTLAGRLLARGNVTEQQVRLLASLDWVLVCAMWLTVVATFGWRAAAVAVIWWGLNYPARYQYTGGAFLRQDWLFCTVVGVCLAKRSHHMSAGAALGAGAMLRLLPGVTLLAPMLGALARKGQWRIGSRRILAGAFVSSLVLFALTAGLSQNEAWREQWLGFYRNTLKHVQTPLVNAVGLRTVLAYDPALRVNETYGIAPGDPWRSWKDGQLQTFRARRLVYWTLAGTFILLVALAVHRQESWVGIVASTGILGITLSPTSYYFGVLLIYGLLWAEYKSIGVGLALLTAFTAVVPLILNHPDDRYFAISLGAVCFLFFATITLCQRRADGDIGRRPASSVVDR